MPRNRHIGKFERGYLDAVRKAHENGAPKERHIRNIDAGERVHDEQSPVIIRSTPITWGIPMDEVMFSKFMVLLLRNGHIMPWDNFATTEGTYLPNARNEIHNMFLDTDFPYLMMLDSDILIPPFLVDKLMAHKKPIVGGFYRNKNKLKVYDPHPIVYDYVSTGEDGAIHWNHRLEAGTGLERVDGMGAGCWLMTHEVASALGRSPYDENGGTEDLVLSKKIMDLGIPMYVDWSLACPHIGVAWT